MTVYDIFAYVGIAAVLLTALRWFIAKPSNLLICFLQNFVGALFIFSGFVKAVDPLGTGYKMHEYFEAFANEGLRPMWEYLAGFSTFFAIVMIAAELFFGLMLLIGWMPKFTVAVVWWLTLFFTFLTGYTYLSGYGITKFFLLLSGIVFVLFAAIAIPQESKNRYKLFAIAATSFIVVALIARFAGDAEIHIKSFHLSLKCFANAFDETKMKVTDCGCFGDFIKLRPWQTFYKDVILDVMILILVLGVKHVSPTFSIVWANRIAGVTGVVSLAFCLYNVYLSEPVIDFRPYKIGKDINEQRKEKRPAKIEMLFLYKDKKTGVVGEYTQKDFATMKFDELEYVDRKDKVLDPGDPAKITNLFISNEDGLDITDTLLHDPNYSMMVVTYNLSKTNEAAFKLLNEIAAGCDKAGLKFYTVTANDGHVDEFRHRNQTAYPFYYADETPLKTMIRSNPGLMLFKNGVVINKWHYRHLPTFDELDKNYFSKH